MTPPPTKWWLSFPGALYAALVLAVVVTLPAILWGGFFVDDLMHLAILEGVPAPAKPWDLFRFADGHAEVIRPFVARGPYPWWTHPELKLWFFRPLSTATAQLDHALFARFAPGYQFQSLLWYLLTVFAAGALYRRTLPVAGAAVAALLFAIDGNHYLPAAWIANRNAVTAVAPALLGLVAHLRWREEQWRWGLPLSVFGYAVGLAGGETALAVLAYVLAFEAVGIRGPRRERMLALMPAAAIGLLYVGIYKVFGFGAWGSAVYIDPTQTPLDYLAAALARVLALASGGLLHLPADLWFVVKGARPLLVGMGALAFACVAWIARAVLKTAEETERRRLSFLILGAALSVLPVLATFPANRLLLVPSIGVCSLFGAAFVHAVGARRKVTLALIGTHVVISVIAWPFNTWLIRMTARTGEAMAAAAELDDARTPEERMVVLNAPDPLMAFYHPMVRRLEGRPLPYAWQVMTMVPKDVRFTRTSDSSFELEIINGRMLEDIFEQLVRSESQPIKRGEAFAIDGAVVKVLEMDGIHPTKLSVTLDAPLEDPRYRILEWRDGAMRVFEPPPVGESVVLVHTPGAMGI